MASLQNCCGEVSAQSKYHIKLKVTPDGKYLLSTDDQDPVNIKEEYDPCNQQLVNNESSLNHLQDCGSSSSSNHSIEDCNVNSFEFVDINKFEKKNSKMSNDSGCSDDSKTQHGSQVKRFKCSVCDKAFAKGFHLKNHIRLHTGERPYTCPTCQKTFTQSAHLADHQLTHSDSNGNQEKQFKCSDCDKTFIRRRSLTLHSRVHTGARPYICPTCQKTFTTSSNLNAHKLIHTSEKPHECDVCHKTFTNKSTLITHERIHSNVRPFKCPVCTKAFTQSSGLRKHKLVHCRKIASLSNINVLELLT